MIPQNKLSNGFVLKKLYFTKIEGCCPASISLNDAVFTYKGIADQDGEYLGVDFWELFGKLKKFLNTN